MKRTTLAVLFLCGAALAAPAAWAQTPVVDVSLNIFPTNFANPNGGGTWTMVAKTDHANGIAAINAYIHGIDSTSVVMESDIAGELTAGGDPFIVPGNPVNIVYFQDTANGPVLGGVGTITQNDGPDPLGDPNWAIFTQIFHGTYPSTVPAFGVKGGNSTDANVLASVMVPSNNAIDANVTTVVRIAVPEPTSISLAALAALGWLRRRREVERT